MATIDRQTAAEIKAAREAGWVSNSLPVKLVNGQLRYDIDKIGKNLGVSQTVIDQVKKLRVPTITARKPSGRAEFETAGSADRYQSQKSAQQRAREQLNRLGVEATTLHNLYQIDAGVPVDFENKVVRTNLAKPGFLSNLRGPGGRFDLSDRITQEKKDTWADFIGTKVLPAAALGVIGAGALSQAGVFGAGNTLLAGGGSATAAAPTVASGVHEGLVSGAGVASPAAAGTAGGAASKITAEKIVSTALAAGSLASSASGVYAQSEANKEAKKARDQVKKQYGDATAAAEATAARIANEELERKRRLAAAGTQRPSTLLGSYAGVSGKPVVKKTLLGGY